MGNVGYHFLHESFSKGSMHQFAHQSLFVDLSSPPPTSIKPSDPTTTARESDTLEAETLAMLSLHPPPDLYVTFIKSLNRPAVSGDQFVSLLYQLQPSPSTKADAIHDESVDDDPKQRLLLTQIVLKMVDTMGEALVKGEETRVLSFVHHALETKRKVPHIPRARTSSDGPHAGLRLDDLKIVDSDDESNAGEDESDDGLDSDDEVELPDRDDDEAEGMFGAAGRDETAEPAGSTGGKLGIVGTAIGLLVAVLQGEDLIDSLLA